MQLHLDEIATKVTPGAHAVVVLDQAGWHKSQALKVPSNILLMPLPPRSPELNPQENIWQFMRQNCEPVPAGVLTASAQLRAPIAPLQVDQLMHDSVPEAWKDGQTTALALSVALSTKTGQPVPWTVLRARHR